MSTFTALNGGEQKADVTMSGSGAEDQRPGSADRANGQQPAAPLAPSSSLPEPSKTAETPTSQRENWTGPSQERSQYPASSYHAQEGESGHKRKRSDSVDMRRDQGTSIPMQERSPPVEGVPVAASHPEPRESREPREAYESRERDYRPYGDAQREHRDRWFAEQRRESQANYEQQNSASTTHTQNEDQISESIRRNQMDADYPNTSPDGDDRSIALYGGSPYSRDGVIQSDPKKRKRNFSNRTKTGCMTCRKRKKKCDETKPECSNCLRGGFLCAGYPPQRGTVWQKPDNKSTVIPLESKDPTYVPPGAYGMPQQNPYGNQLSVPQPQKRDPLSSYRGQPLRIDPPQGRPLVTDDDRATASTIPSASVTSPDNKLSALSTYTPATAFPTPVSANQTPSGPFSDMRKEYQRVPPLHDLSRTEPETPHPGNTLPHINVIPTTRTSSPVTNKQSQPQPQPQPPTSSAQAAAQMALSHPPFPSSRPRTQKEEMLSGRHFYPFDRELCLERERCSGACWRFNQSSNPNTGISAEERSRLFRAILQPRDPIQISPTQTSPVTNVGHVGDNVVVEAPFTCDYGYNITIGQNVVIGKNCTITDACEVKIGDNVHIGPNVSIYTNSLPIDPKRRMGSKGPQVGRPITIDQDCWIGGGAIILPGRTVGRGSTVGAGAIVTKDVPPFTIVVGNPARVLRGVSSSS